MENHYSADRLPTGVAAVFQKGWLTPVLMKIDKWDNRYETEVKRPLLDEIRVLKGLMLQELYRQYQEQSYSPISMKKIIRKSFIDSEKKKDFEDIVGIMNKLLIKRAGSLYKEDLGELYLQISGCIGLLEVIDDRKIYSFLQLEKQKEKNPNWFTQKEKRDLIQRSKKWLDRFMASFNQYAYVEDQTVLRDIIYHILYLKSDNGHNKASKYRTLLVYMHNNII